MELELLDPMRSAGGGLANDKCSTWGLEMIGERLTSGGGLWANYHDQSDLWTELKRCSLGIRPQRLNRPVSPVDR